MDQQLYRFVGITALTLLLILFVSTYLIFVFGFISGATMGWFPALFCSFLASLIWLLIAVGIALVICGVLCWGRSG